jgi:hypothetical protein
MKNIFLKEVENIDKEIDVQQFFMGVVTAKKNPSPLIQDSSKLTPT